MFPFNRQHSLQFRLLKQYYAGTVRDMKKGETFAGETPRGIYKRAETEYDILYSVRSEMIPMNHPVQILVIDAQGGGIGKQLVAAIKQAVSGVIVTAVGTNSAATSAMLKAGADRAATGENAVVVACRHADVIIGPVGIAIADSLLGEITPAMALAVGQSNAARILIPSNRCGNLIAGVTDQSMGDLVRHAVQLLQDLLGQTVCT